MGTQELRGVAVDGVCVCGPLLLMWAQHADPIGLSGAQHVVLSQVVYKSAPCAPQVGARNGC